MLRRYQVRGRRVPVPTTSTHKSNPQPIDYKAAKVSSFPNDLQPKSTLPYITDMRFDGVGKYKTRKGCDRYSIPVGEAVNVEVTSTTGASDAAYSTTTWIAEKITATATGPNTRIDINAKNSAGATGITLVSLYSDNAGSPGSELSCSSVSQDSLTASYGYKTTYSIQAPTMTSSASYWVVIRLQNSGVGSMYASATTTSTNAKTSSNAGQTWSSTSYSLNVKVYSATAGSVNGTTRIYRPNGVGYTFFAHGTNLYLVNDSNGTTSIVDSGLSPGYEKIRYDYVNDVLYYTDGVGRPRRYNFSTSSVVAGAPYNASDIMEHAGLLFYFDADDRNQAFYTNFADYEVFTSTDTIYVPAPKKSDKLTAMAKLNGALYFFLRRNKYMLLGTDTATFRLSEAYAQRGTFSQESVVFDNNHIYFASDDGVFQFNGTSEKNILENVITEYMDIDYKDDIHLQIHNNRVYIWYRPNGSAEVNECFVYNTLYGVVETSDLNTYIGSTFARHDTTDMFIQASNRCGALYYAEKKTNDYDNLGAPIYAEVRTAYDHFGKPQQKKRIPYWRPIIETVAKKYSMQAGFAADHSDDVTFSDVNLQGVGYIYDDAASVYDSARYASTASSNDMTLNIFGSACRWQRRYKHHAAREPFVFAGEVLTVETERLR